MGCRLKASNGIGVPGMPRGHGRTFLLEYTYAGQSPAVKQQIVDMALNASGIRDTARVLHVSPTTVTCIWGSQKHQWATLGFQCLI
jgi:hypothetical protein